MIGENILHRLILIFKCLLLENYFSYTIGDHLRQRQSFITI